MTNIQPPTIIPISSEGRFYFISDTTSDAFYQWKIQAWRELPFHEVFQPGEERSYQLIEDIKLSIARDRQHYDWIQFNVESGLDSVQDSHCKTRDTFLTDRLTWRYADLKMVTAEKYLNERERLLSAYKAEALLKIKV